MTKWSCGLMLVLGLLLDSQLAQAQQLRFMSFNIHHGVGQDGRLDLARTAAVIRDSGADIIGLQEVDRYFSTRSNCQDQVNQLATRLGYYAVFFASLNYPGDLFICGWGQRRQYGNAILSRYPIYRWGYAYLPKEGNNEQRSLLWADFYINGRWLRAYSTHFSFKSVSERRLQAETVVLNLMDIMGSNSSTFLMGDFNASALSYEMASINFYQYNSALADPSADPGRIDLIFASRLALSSQYIPTDASDHEPLLAVYYWP